jgi:NAD(P)-dependent dehydrogenase (short-subunit alcohol dehydrogenase family)
LFINRSSYKLSFKVVLQYPKLEKYITFVSVSQKMMASVSPNTTLVLITGATSGIGFATAEALASEPYKYHVLMGARNAEKSAEKVAELQKKGLPVELITIDVTSDSSIEAAAAEVASKYGHLDVLINNAGICLERTPNGAPMAREMYQETFNTNVFGAGITTEAFIPLLKKSTKVPRIVFVTSSLGSLGRKAEGTHVSSKREFPIYRASKAAMNMLCLHYDMLFKEASWKVNTCDPGRVITNLIGGIPEHFRQAALANGAVMPEVGATNSIRLATLGKDGESGTFSCREGPLPW